MGSLTYHLKMKTGDGTCTSRDYPSRAEAAVAAVQDMRDTADEMEQWAEDLPFYATKAQVELDIAKMYFRLRSAACTIEDRLEYGRYGDSVDWPAGVVTDQWEVSGEGFIGSLIWEVWKA